MQQYFVERLLRAFILTQLALPNAHENIDDIIFDAKDRCEDIQLAWKDNFVPDWAWQKAKHAKRT